MYTPKSPDLYPGYQLAVSSISGQHSNYFHNSRILANAVPLGFFCGGFSSTADYDPATKLNLRQAARAPWRVLASGFHSFLSEWLEKVSQPSLAEPFGSDSRRQWNQQPPVFSLSRASPHRLPIPLSVSNAVTFVTGCLYAATEFRSNFSVFYFCVRLHFFDRDEITNKNRPETQFVTS